MIDPLRYTRETLPTHEIDRPAFCSSCLSQRRTRSNPNVAVAFCRDCTTTLSGKKEFGALLCRACEQEKHRSAETRSHARQIVVVGPGVRKKVLVRGDGVTFPRPLDSVAVRLRASIYSGGERVGKQPWQTLRFHTGLSGKCLHIQVLGARKLRGMDVNDAPDAFVVYSFCGRPLGATRVRPQSRNPRWAMETFVVPVEDFIFAANAVSAASSASLRPNSASNAHLPHTQSPRPPTMGVPSSSSSSLVPTNAMPRGMLASQRDLVKFEVFDSQWATQSRLLGQVEMSKSKLMKLAVVANEQPVRVPLNFREHHGLLHLQMGMTEEDFLVRVLCAEDLDKKGFGRYNDVHVKVYLGESRLIGSTPVVFNAVNPVWTEGHEFRVSLAEILQIEAQLETQIALYKQAMGLQTAEEQEIERQLEKERDAEMRRERQREREEGEEGEKGSDADGEEEEQYVEEAEEDDSSDKESDNEEEKKEERRRQTVLRARAREKEREQRRARGQQFARMLDEFLSLEDFEQLPEYLSLVRAEVYDRSDSNSSALSLTSSNDRLLGSATLPLRVLRKALPDLPPKDEREILEEREREREREKELEQSFLGRTKQLLGQLSRSMSFSLPQSFSFSRSFALLPTVDSSSRKGNEGESSAESELDSDEEQQRHRHEEEQEMQPNEVRKEDESNKGSVSSREKTVKEDINEDNKNGLKRNEQTEADDDRARDEGSDSDKESIDDEEKGRREQEIDVGESVSQKETESALSRIVTSLSRTLWDSFSSQKMGPRPRTHKEEQVDEDGREERQPWLKREEESERQSPTSSQRLRSREHSDKHAFPRPPPLLPVSLPPFISSAPSPTAWMQQHTERSSRAPSIPLVEWADTLRVPITTTTTAGGSRASEDDENSHGALILRLFIASRGVVCTGIDSAVQRMTLGESSVVKLRFDELYGSFAVSSDIPPRANAILKMRLVQVENQGLAGLPSRFARRVFRAVVLIGGLLLVLLGLRAPDPTKKNENVWKKILATLGFVRNEDDDESDEEESDSEDSVDTEEAERLEREAQEAFLAEQRRLEEEENLRRAQLEEAGKVDRRMRKHLTPAVKEGVRLLWGAELKEPLHRKRPPGSPPSPFKRGKKTDQFVSKDSGSPK